MFHSGRLGIRTFMDRNRHLRAHAEKVMPSAAAPWRSKSSSSSETEMDIACRLRWFLLRTRYRLTVSTSTSGAISGDQSSEGSERGDSGVGGDGIGDAKGAITGGTPSCLISG